MMMMMMVMGARSSPPPPWPPVPVLSVRMYVLVRTGLDDGMYVFMYVSMCSVGWDGRRNLGAGLLLCYFIFVKRILDDVLMTFL